jgi:hypothetical protein
MKKLISLLSLLSLMLFVGCLGEDPISNEKNENSSDDTKEESSATTDTDDSSPSDNDSSTPDSTDEPTDSSNSADSEETEETSSTTEDLDETEESSSTTEDTETTDSATTEESSDSTEETPSSSTTNEETESSTTESQSDYDTEGSTSPTGNGIFEDWEDGDAQNSLATNVALENDKSALDAGGYWYAYTDDKGSTLTTLDGTDLVSGDADVIEAIDNNALHVVFNSGNSTEDHPVAGLGVNLMYGTEEDDADAPRVVDLTGMTAVKLRLKGTPSQIIVAFDGLDKPAWGAYDKILTITKDWKEFTIPVEELEGSLHSDIAGETVEEQINQLLSLSFSISGADKDKEITLSIDYIQFIGIDEASVPYVDL